MSASTYINIEITYHSDTDKFYIDYIYNDQKYDTDTLYGRFSTIEYLAEYLNMNYNNANSLIDDVINNS